MKRKPFFIIAIMIVLLIISYVLAEQNSFGEFFRTSTPMLALSEAEGVPTTFTPTSTHTATFAPTATNTLISTATLTPTPTSTFTPTSTATIAWSYLDDDSDGVPNYADQCPAQYAETDDGCPQNGGGSSDDWNDDGGPGDG